MLEQRALNALCLAFIDGKKVKGKGKGRKKKKDKDTDDEAVEDSDDGDKEAKQVDYMSDTSDR